MDEAIKTYGKRDIMFNNARKVDKNIILIKYNEKAKFERVLRVNVIGVFLSIKHAAQAIITARSGSIISAASVCSYIGGGGTHAILAQSMQ